MMYNLFHCCCLLLLFVGRDSLLQPHDKQLGPQTHLQENEVLAEQGSLSTGHRHLPCNVARTATRILHQFLV